MKRNSGKPNFKGRGTGKQKPQERQFKSGKVEVDIPRDDLNASDLNVSAKRYTSKRNDATWYAKNSQLLLDAGQLSFNFPTGVRIPFYQTSKVTEPRVVSPGICTFYFVPTVGQTLADNSPVNLAAKMQYANIRYANSGSAYGEPADLMMYYVACDSLYMFHQMCARAYGIMKLYTYDNRYYPQTIIEAMGLDFSDLEENLAQFRYFINKLAIQLQSFAVPNDISYFLRHSWLASGLYLDSDEGKAQTYMFMPAAYYKYVEVTSGPPKLELKTPYSADTVQGSTKLKLSNLVNFSEDLIRAILNSEYFGVTTGDIVKAFGRDNLFKISEISEDYVVLPVYNTEVLSQIENASVNCCSLQKLTGLDVTQSTVGGSSYLISSAILSSYPVNKLETHTFLYLLTNNLEFILNMHIPSPTPADVLVATRLRTMVKNSALKIDGGAYVEQQLAEYGSEVIVGAAVAYYDQRATSNPIQHVLWSGMGSHVGLNGNGNGYGGSGALFNALLQQFDWHPQLNIFTCDQNNTTMTTQQDIWLPDNTVVNYGDTRDLDNFALVQQATFKRMNETAMLSLFDSPRVASLTRTPYRK